MAIQIICAECGNDELSFTGRHSSENKVYFTCPECQSVHHVNEPEE